MYNTKALHRWWTADDRNPANFPLGILVPLLPFYSLQNTHTEARTVHLSRDFIGDMTGNIHNRDILQGLAKSLWCIFHVIHFLSKDVV